MLDDSLYSVMCFFFTEVTLDSSKVCSSNTADNIYWASKQKAILVIGRGASDRELFLDCSIIVGAAATESTLLQLHFEAFHIKDCGVMLAVNQSNRSDFTPDNSVMVISIIPKGAYVLKTDFVQGRADQNKRFNGQTAVKPSIDFASDFSFSAHVAPT